MSNDQSRDRSESPDQPFADSCRNGQANRGRLRTGDRSEDQGLPGGRLSGMQGTDLTESTPWRVTAAASTLGFALLVALAGIVWAGKAAAPPWVWVVAAALWLGPGAFLCILALRSRRGNGGRD